MIIVATAALVAVALWSARSRAGLSRSATRLALLGLLASTAAVAATAWTGGPIGHPELRPSASAGP